MNSTEITRATPTDAGCWIDGHWGRYGLARMVEIAASYGFDQEDDDAAALVEVALRHLGNIAQPTEITDDEHEWLSDQADNIEVWLNEHVAPEGHSFGWHEGEFFLWADEMWEEESY